MTTQTRLDGRGYDALRFDSAQIEEIRQRFDERGRLSALQVF